jgi:hypothetical protein
MFWVKPRHDGLREIGRSVPFGGRPTSCAIADRRLDANASRSLIRLGYPAGGRGERGEHAQTRNIAHQDSTALKFAAGNPWRVIGTCLAPQV